MGLEIPTLDDREYEQILAEAMKQLAVHTDEWTDHNAHDPGITILEMLAWVAEAYGYQLDQITDVHREKYLQLVGTPPRSPVSAAAELALTAEGSATPTIPPGEPLVVDDGSGSLRRFETTRSVALTDARVARVVSEHRRDRSDLTNANRTDGLHFLAFGEQAARGSVLYVGFEGDPFGAGSRFDLAVDFHDDDLPDPEEPIHGDGDVTFEPSVDLAWQFCTEYEQWFRDEAWADLTVENDGTNRLYQGGTISFARPENWQGRATGIRILDAVDDLAWLRCVVKTPGYEVPPQLDGLRVNVVTATHRAARGRERLQRLDGGEETTAQPNQAFAFPHAPVLEASIAVGSEQWDRVPDFAGSGPDDRHYVIDEMDGTVRFGDGVRGRVPAAGQRVVAEEYTTGGGAVGNVPASATWAFENERFRDVVVTPRGGATGGADAETVDAALTRQQLARRTPHRVVTPSDYEAVATSTPGLRFGRAAALVGPTDDREGEECATHHSVRVVVVPYGTGPRPVPSEGFLRAVDAHLQHNRLLTDRVTAEAPTYVGIGVNADVRLEAGASVAGRTAAVEAALDAFLDPLTGFEGDGWPFGRPVYQSELYEVIESVDGVDYVADVSIRARGGTGTDDGDIRIPDSTLVAPESHEIVVKGGP